MNFISNEMLPLVLALVSGVLMAVQGSLNTALSKVIGLLEATFFVHITGTILAVILLFSLKWEKVICMHGKMHLGIHGWVVLLA